MTRPAAAGRPAVTVGEFLRVVGRHRLLLALVVLLCLLAGGVLNRVRPASYQATAIVDITPPAGSGIDPKSVSTATQQNVVTSSEVTARAAAALADGSTSDSVRARLAVTSPLDSLVLDISFTSSSAAGAADGANAVARAYLDYGNALSRAQLDARAARVEARIAALRDQFVALPKTSDQRPGLQSQISALEQQLNTITATVVSTGQLVGPAAPPTAPAGPGLPIYLAGALAIGLLLGTVVSVVRDRRADAIRSVTELEGALGGPVLAVVPQERARRRHEAPIVAVTDAGGPEADAFRALALKLSAALSAGESRAFALAGTDHAARIPANLAVSTARAGKRTVLAGTANAAEQVRRLFEVADDAAPRRGRTGMPDVRVVSLGEEFDLDEFLDHRAEALVEAAADADVVLLDAVNVRQHASVLSLARWAGAAVVVARIDVTRHSALRGLQQELEQLGVRVIGGVLLSRPVRRTPRRLLRRAVRREPGPTPRAHAPSPTAAPRPRGTAPSSSAQAEAAS